MKAKIRVLFKRIRRSFRSDREQWIKGGILAVILLVIVIFAGSCACSKKNAEEPDAASTSVMKITPVSSPTPTVVPRQVSKDAVAQSGGVTMVNEYLLQKEDSSTDTQQKDNAGDTSKDTAETDNESEASADESANGM